MSAPTGEDVARHYRSAHDRICALASTLTEEQLATPVAATPGWTVHDVLAHLAAVPTDVMSGRLTGLPTDEFTAGQVEERRDATAADLTEEWQRNVEAMCEGARAGLAPPALAVDALTHEQDIRAALGLEPAAAAEEIRFCTGVYCAGFARSVGGAGLPAVTIAASDSDFTQTVGAGEVTATVRAPEFELFRALSGRRSREQILAYDWTGDAASYVEHFGRFGHLATTAVTG